MITGGNRGPGFLPNLLSQHFFFVIPNPLRLNA